MYASTAEQIENRTPYSPEGFSHLNKPEASRIFNIPGGRVHYFAGRDYQRNLPRLIEYAIRLDMAAFKIPYWVAMREVSFNMRKDLRKIEAVSASFFEPDESLATPLLQNPQEKGRERMRSSAFIDRLFNPFNQQAESPTRIESEIGLNHPFKAYATHEIWKINIDSSVLPVQYCSTMAVDPEYAGKGIIGPSLFQIACNLNQPVLVVFRARNGGSLSALEKALTTEGLAYGVDIEWNDDPEMASLKPVLLDFLLEKTLHPYDIDDKLIAKGVYAEGKDRTYIHGLSKGRAADATEKLENRGVVDENGDGAYIAKWGKGKKEQWGRIRKGRERLDINSPVAKLL